MTLDEAIAIAKESSENQYMGDRGREDFKQLAAWLEELKQYKEENQPEKMAEEMFEALDFWSRKRNDTEIVWTRKVREDFIEKEIIFNLVVAKVAIEGGWLTKEEMRAVSKQCEELGWFGWFGSEQETNLDRYKHEILEKGLWNLAVVKGRPKRCDRTKCIDCELSKDRSRGCHEKAIAWLEQPCKDLANKLTKFEFDLLQSYPSKYKFKDIPVLDRMKEKGYFKGADEDATIRDILADCEITEED